MIPELVSRVDYYQGPDFFCACAAYCPSRGPCEQRITKNSLYNPER